MGRDILWRLQMCWTC